jgi:hypothetical protein
VADVVCAAGIVRLSRHRTLAIAAAPALWMRWTSVVKTIVRYTGVRSKSPVRSIVVVCSLLPAET